ERPALRDARRLASAWRAAFIASKTRVNALYGHAPRVPYTHGKVTRRSATPRSGSVKQGCKPRAQKCAAGTKWAVRHRELRPQTRRSSSSGGARTRNRYRKVERACARLEGWQHQPAAVQND